MTIALQPALPAGPLHSSDPSGPFASFRSTVADSQTTPQQRIALMSHLSLDLTSLLHCNQHGPSDRCIPATRADHLHLPGPPLATSVSDCFFKKHFGEVWGIAPFRLQCECEGKTSLRSHSPGVHFTVCNRRLLLGRRRRALGIYKPPPACHAVTTLASAAAVSDRASSR